MKYTFVLPVVALLSLSACEGFVPAPQGPRVYTAAHDTVDGECQNVRITRDYPGNTIDAALPNHTRAVKCLTDMGQTTKPD